MRTHRGKSKPANCRVATPSKKHQSPLKDSNQALPSDTRSSLHGVENSGYGSDDTNSEGSMLTSVRLSQDIVRAKENADSVPRKYDDRDLLHEDNDYMTSDSERSNSWSKRTLRSPKCVPKKNSNEESKKLILPTWTGYEEGKHFPQTRSMSNNDAIEAYKRVMAENAQLKKENQELKRGRSVKGNRSLRSSKLHIGNDDQGNSTFSSVDGLDSAPGNISGVEGFNETLPSMGEVIEGVKLGREKQTTSTKKGKYSGAPEITTPSNGTNGSKPDTTPAKKVEKRKTVTPLTIRLDIKNPKASVVEKKVKKTTDVDTKDKDKVIDSDKKDTNIVSPKVAVSAVEQSSSSRKRGRTLKDNSCVTPKSSKNKKEPKKKTSQESLDRNNVSGAAGDTPMQDSLILPKKTVKAKSVHQDHSQDLQKEPLIPNDFDMALDAILNGANLEDVVKKEPVDLDDSTDLQNVVLNDSNHVSVKREPVDDQDKKERSESNDSIKRAALKRKIKREPVDNSFGEDGQGQSNAGNPSKRVKVDENGEVFDMTKGVADWDDVKFAGMSEVLKMAERSRGNKFTTIAPKVQRKLYKTDSVYYLDRIVDKTKEPANNKDRVFMVQWLHWNDTADTMCSIEDLRGSKDEFKAFSAYEKAVSVIYEQYCSDQIANIGTSKYAPPQKPKYEMLTKTGFCSEWKSDSWWQRQRKSPNFLRTIGLNWYFKILEREWTTVLRTHQPFAGGLRLLTFYKHQLTKEFQKFRYIAENEYTRKAKEFVKSAPIRDGCTCGCGKFCEACKLSFPYEIVQLDGDRIQATKLQMTADFFACIRCGPRSECPADAACRRLPIRRSQLLITYVPKVQGLGVFAVELLRPGDILGEYMGQVSRVSEIDPRASRNYQYETYNNILIEARYAGNETRFVNHSCDPNVRTLILFHDNAASCPRLYFVAVKYIQPGEQLLIDYHPGHVKGKPAPIGSSKCACGSTGENACRGFL